MEVGLFFIIVVILGFAAYTILTNFSTQISSFDTEQDNYSEMVTNINNKTTTTLDWITLLFLLLALIFSIIGARKIPTDPLYIGIILSLSVLFFILSFVVSNIFGGLMDNTNISNFVNLKLPITNILLTYFPFLVAVYEGIVIVVFFSKNE
jgi:hypothetical protein